MPRRVWTRWMPDVRRQGSGRIVNISSVLGLIPAPFMALYAASKHAVAGVTKALANEWAKHGIQSSWAGDMAKLSGKVLGVHLDATLRVTDRTVGGEATDPGLLLRGQAKKYLTHKFATWLDPTRSLEELADDGGES